MRAQNISVPAQRSNEQLASADQSGQFEPPPPAYSATPVAGQNTGPSGRVARQQPTAAGLQALASSQNASHTSSANQSSIPNKGNSLTGFGGDHKGGLSENHYAVPAYDDNDPRIGQLTQLCKKHKIRGSAAEDLVRYAGHMDIGLLCDDSGSMRGDRWDELKDRIGVIAPIAGCLDTDGISIGFLNRQNYIPNFTGFSSETEASSSKSFGKKFLSRFTDKFSESRKQLTEIFKKKPELTDLTPLSRATIRFLRQQDQNATFIDADGVKRPKPFELIIPTDGEPNEGFEAFFDTLRRAVKGEFTNGRPVHVALMMCTENDALVGAYNKIDSDPEVGEFIDVIDDFKSERNEVFEKRQAQGKPRGEFTTGDYLAKTILGCVVKKWDRMDEISLNSD